MEESVNLVVYPSGWWEVAVQPLLAWKMVWMRMLSHDKCVHCCSKYLVIKLHLLTEHNYQVCSWIIRWYDHQANMAVFNHTVYGVLLDLFSFNNLELSKNFQATQQPAGWFHLAIKRGFETLQIEYDGKSNLYSKPLNGLPRFCHVGQVFFESVPLHAEAVVLQIRRPMYALDVEIEFLRGIWKNKSDLLEDCFKLKQ